MIDFDRGRQFVKEAPGTFLGKAATLMTAAFGFVAALAWNDAIQALVKTLFNSEAGTIVAKFGYALVITIVFTLISLRFAKQDEQK